MAVIRLPEPYRSIAHTRSYLPAGILLIKPVVTRAGDAVCRLGPIVTLQWRLVAYARASDKLGRGLPRWSGCRRLRAHQIFLLSPHPDGFDSRYFGALERTDVVGTALPIFAAAAQQP
jgi:type IV secretory pathway protease TraF